MTSAGHREAGATRDLGLVHGDVGVAQAAGEGIMFESQRHPPDRGDAPVVNVDIAHLAPLTSQPQTAAAGRGDSPRRRVGGKLERTVMADLNRRTFLAGSAALAATLAGCKTTPKKTDDPFATPLPSEEAAGHHDDHSAVSEHDYGLVPRTEIEVARAEEHNEDYRRALESLGCRVIVLPRSRAW